MITISSLNGQMPKDEQKIYQRICIIQHFEADPEFRNNPENFHPWRSEYDQEMPEP